MSRLTIYPGRMATPLWAPWGQRCSATSKRTGRQCGQYCPPGALVCDWHGGAAPNAREAAARRWQRELAARKTEREAELRLGRPLDDFEKAIIRHWAKGDPATYRQHVRTRDADPD